MHRREFLKALALSVGGTPLLAPAVHGAETNSSNRRFNVRELGAIGDGQRLETATLQAVIDACAGAGGGTVQFPTGAYLTGTLFLKSRVTIHLEAGATLLGNPRLGDYPKAIPALRSYTDNYTERSLLYGENLEQVSLEGHGTINGQGAAFKGPYRIRPYLLRLIGCRDVAVTGITFKDSPMWVQHYLACDGVRIDGITVRSHCSANNDGIDIDACAKVRIANCDISSGDDAIVLKSTLDRPCRNVVISNCVLSSDCNALKLGTESNGGFENIAISNCAISDTGLAGLAVELVDGGTLERVSISNITMRDTRGAVFIRLGNRARPFTEGMAAPRMGTLRRVSISGVQADGVDRIGCSITGLPDHPAEDITLENIRLRFAGGATAEDAGRTVPEHPEKYPEYRMFGLLPAYGFYCRHVRGLHLRNVRVDLTEPDPRPSLICEDVEDVEVSGWNAEAAAKTAPVLQFNEVRRGFVHACRSPEGGGVFLRVDGAGSRKIRLAANDLAPTGKLVELGSAVLAGTVSMDEPGRSNR